MIAEPDDRADGASARTARMLVTSRPFSRCPAAQIRSASPIAPIDRADRQRLAASAWPATARSAPSSEAERHARAARATRRRSDMPPQARRDACSRRCTAAHTSGDRDLVEAPRRLVAAPLVVAAARCRTATRPRRPAHHGPLRSGSVGPKRLTIGVPTAAAMCSGPVSPDTTSAAARASATQVGDRRSRGASTAAPADAATTAAASASSPGPQSTTGVSPHASRRNAASSPNRSGGQRLFGHAAPGLSSANGAIRGIRRRSSSSAADADVGERKPRSPSSCTPSARSSAQVLVDDVRAALGVVRVGVERARGLLAQVPDREADDPRARPTRAPAPPTSSAPADRSRRRRTCAAARAAPPVHPRERRALERNRAIDGGRRDRRSPGASRRPASRCARAGKRACAAPPPPGTAWTMSPSAPRRTIRMIHPRVSRASRSRVE